VVSFQFHLLDSAKHLQLCTGSYSRTFNSIYWIPIISSSSAHIWSRDFQFHLLDSQIWKTSSTAISTLQLSIPFIGFSTLKTLMRIYKTKNLSIPFIGFWAAMRYHRMLLVILYFQFHLLDSCAFSLFAHPKALLALSIPFIGFILLSTPLQRRHPDSTFNSIYWIPASSSV